MNKVIFQKSVKDEQFELKVKIADLKALLYSDFFDSLPEYEQILVQSQLEAMEQYSRILQQRIENFEL